MGYKLQPELLNTSFNGGFNFLEAQQYVTIESCKAAMNQTQYWMYILGVLFVISWCLFCYYLYKYKKVKKN